MRDGIRLYNMQVARKFAEILPLVQFPHTVEQCFPVGGREQLQAFLVASRTVSGGMESINRLFTHW